MIPILILKVSEISLEDKRNFAQFLQAAVSAYIEDRPADFAVLLAQTSMTDANKDQVIKALWQ